MSMLPEYPSDPIGYLLRRKFGNAALSGPVSGLVEDEEETQTRLFQDLEAYRTELQGLEEEELFARAYQEREKEAHELRELEEQTPFYNRPNAQADFQYWAKFPLWTLDEAVALTLRKDPRVVTWQKIEEYAETSPFAARFDNLRRFVLRAKEAQQLLELVSPTNYIAWAKANNVTVPPELEASVQAFSGTAPDWRALYEEAKLKLASVADELERLKAADKPLSEKEKNTFYKMLLGMAVAIYGYDPRAPKGPTAKEIADELARVGIPINVDTVRKWLQKAANEFGDLVPKLDEK
jgi:hypothetical protein